MSQTERDVIIALITTIPPTIVALAAWRSSHKGRKETIANGASIETIHRAVNSQRDVMQSKIDHLTSEVQEFRRLAAIRPDDRA